MKNPARIRTGLVAALWMFMGTHVMGQGSLTPPGAPGETMKSLAQVEPRTPISSLPYTITESGSYYVVSNLHSTTHGIVIETSGVTVDLMGFSLTGDGTSSYPDNDYGIYVDGSTNAVIDRVVIKGGSISGFYYGLYCEYMNNSRIEQMVVSGNNSYGVFLRGYQGQCDGNTIADCTISGNDTYGVYLDGYQGQCDGNTIADSTISGNGNDGVFLRGYQGQCDGNTIADSSISGNGDKGVLLDGQHGQCNGNTIAACSISDNSSYGVWLRGYQGQCDGNTIADCTISGNDTYGVYLDGYQGQCDGNRVHGNQISKNVNRGIYLYHADGNRVEANNVWGTTGASTYGIRTYLTTGNFILKNTCMGQTNNFDLSVSDTYGPEVTSSGALSSTGDASHAWANFSR